MKSWKYRTKITSCYDADTFTCKDFDMGLGIYLSEVKIRLYGCDAPEIRTKNLKEKEAGLKARDIVRSLIEGKEIEIETLAKPDKFGRVLANIVLPDGKDLAKFLIAEKLAKEYYGGTKEKFEKMV
jgi:micrococcal nuclease